MKQTRLFPGEPPESNAEAAAPQPPASSGEAPPGRRRRPVRTRSLSLVRLPKGVWRTERLEFEQLERSDPLGQIERPRTRGDCADAARPCPFVSCRHHVYLDVSRFGSIKINRPEVEPEDLTESCVLDVAERGGLTPERVGEIMNISRTRIQQIEIDALERLEGVVGDDLREFAGVAPVAPVARTGGRRRAR